MPLNNMNGGQQWHDDHCVELTQLLATGMIYREIARTINEKFGTSFSKNSVVGKVCRLGLIPPDKPKRPPYVRKPKKSTANKGHHHVVDRIVRANSNSNAMRIIKTVEMEQYKLRCVEIECATPFDEVTGCWYPAGDGPFLFCNGARTKGSSYCLNHHVLCSEKPRVPVYRFVGRDAA